ncbi:MAG: peptide chain release factor 3, partial [Pseudomonadales bacterium]
QLAEEGASQVFKPRARNELIVGAVGTLQFDLVAYRLRDEYGADCVYDESNIFTARWVQADDEKMLAEFSSRHHEQLALDGGGHLTYLAPTRANLQLVEERWPDISFLKTREH